MTGDVVVLDGDRHESALAEKRGQFQEVCGCGWRSSWTTDEAAGKEHADHVAAEKLWGRLTEPQRAAIDLLVAAATHSDRPRRFSDSACVYAHRQATTDRFVNHRAAQSLADRGLARITFAFGGSSQFYASEVGIQIHPLSRCSARHGGDPCGYCHACRRRLPVPDLGACPHCSATDWDDD